MKIVTLLLSLLFATAASAQLIPDSLWSVQSERYGLGNPLLEDGIYYTGTEKGVVTAINTATGKVLWKAKVAGGLYHNIVSTETDIIMPCAKHGDVVVSLNKKTGKQNWQIEGYNFDDDVPCLFVKDGDQVIFNSLDSTIVSLNINTGKELWKYKAGGQTSPPVLYGKLIVFTANDGNIYQITKQGKPDSKINFGTSNRRSRHMPPVIYENTVVMSDTGTVIKAYSLQSKKKLWETVCPSPFLLGFNDKAVCATDSGLVAFDIKTGKKSWTVPGRHEWYIYPCVFDNKFYYYSRKSDKLLVIASDGKVFTEFYLKGKTYTAPRVSADKIILSLSDKIFAIENK